MGKSEDIVIEQINLKKAEGYKYLYDNYYQSLCNFSSKFFKHKADSEDIVQDVIFSLWKSNSNFNSIKAITSYLYLCVKNASLNAIRNTSKLSDIDISNNIEIQNLKIGDKSIEQILITEEYYRQIFVAINKLSPERKNIILLSMEGFSNKEIAENAGISFNTVKTLKLKAYRLLKKELEWSVLLLLTYFIN